MENYLLMKKSQEALEMSERLGFTKTYFLEEDLVLISEKNEKKIKGKISKKDLLNKIKISKKKGLRVLVRVYSEEILRFVLEKTPAEMVVGVEMIHPKDSVHFLRSGLDQVLCKIAAANKKVIVFSLADILNCKDRVRLLARMKMNIKLCQKYKVKMMFSNFSKELWEMRGVKELEAFFQVISS